MATGAGQADFIRFACPACNAAIRVPARHAGRTAKCKTCGSGLNIPRFEPAETIDPAGGPDLLAAFAEAEPVPAPASPHDPRAASSAGHLPTPATPNLPSGKALLKIFLPVSVGVIVLLVGSLLAIHLSLSAKQNRLFNELEAAVGARLQEARTSADAYNFEKGRQSIDDARKQVDRSTLSRARVLRARLDEASRALDAARRDYNDKVAKGWEVFEGHLMTPEDRDRILSDRKRVIEKQAQQELERLHAAMQPVALKLEKGLSAQDARAVQDALAGIDSLEIADSLKDRARREMDAFAEDCISRRIVTTAREAILDGKHTYQGRYITPIREGAEYRREYGAMSHEAWDARDEVYRRAAQPNELEARLRLARGEDPLCRDLRERAARDWRLVSKKGMRPRLIEQIDNIAHDMAFLALLRCTDRQYFNVEREHPRVLPSAPNHSHKKSYDGVYARWGNDNNLEGWVVYNLLSSLYTFDNVLPPVTEQPAPYLDLSTASHFLRHGDIRIYVAQLLEQMNSDIRMWEETVLPVHSKLLSVKPLGDGSTPGSSLDLQLKRQKVLYHKALAAEYRKGYAMLKSWRAKEWVAASINEIDSVVSDAEGVLARAREAPRVDTAIQAALPKATKVCPMCGGLRGIPGPDANLSVAALIRRAQHGPIVTSIVCPMCRGTGRVPE